MPSPKPREPLRTSDASDELLAHTYPLERLLEGARQRYRAHVGELQRRYGPGLLRRIEREDQTVTADGILSEVFMRLPDALASYEHREKFEAFLWTITKRALIDKQRGRRRQPYQLPSEGFDLAGVRAPNGSLERDDLIERLAAPLPPRQREVWIRHVRGFSNTETAEALGITANAVGVTLQRAWAAVRAHADRLRLRPSDLIESGLSVELLLPPGGYGSGHAPR